MSILTSRAGRPVNPRIAESAAHRAPARAMPIDEIRNGLAEESGVIEVERIGKAALKIPVGRIEPDPDQPRKSFDPDVLQRLAVSIKRTGGLLTPIRVRAPLEPNGRYRIIAGECRWQAAGLAGLAVLDCIVDDKPDKSRAEVLADQLTENAVRSDLRPMELARGYYELTKAFNWTGSECAEQMGVSQSSVSEALALLKLPVAVQEAIDSGTYPASAAISANALTAELQIEVMGDYLAGRLENRAEVKERVAELLKAGASQAPIAMPSNPKVGRPAKGRGVKAATIKKTGKAKPLPTSRTMRTATGHKVTVEHRRGVDDAGLATALEEILSTLRAEQGVDAEAA